MAQFSRSAKTMALCAVAVAFSESSVHAQPQTVINSTSTAGTYSNRDNSTPTLSDDGRYAIFNSRAANLVPNDTNNAYDVFVKDNVTGTTRRVSTTSTGAQANGHSTGALIAPDGSFAIINSRASNLVPGDTNGQEDFFLKDLQTGQVTRLSLNWMGQEPNVFGCGAADLSRNGRYVSFSATANNMFPGDTNGVQDGFVYDLQTRTYMHVTRTSTGGLVNQDAEVESVTSDGRYVVFETGANNVVPNDTNNSSDVFLRDIKTGTVTLVSADAQGTIGNSISKIEGKNAISEDGLWVAFTSHASNLVPGDTNAGADIFKKNTRDGSIYRVSLSNTGAEATTSWRNEDSTISPDGRFVTFSHLAGNLTANDTNSYHDVFVRDTLLQTTTLVSVSQVTGNSGNFDSVWAFSTPDNRYAAFESGGSDMVTPAPVWGRCHVYRRDHARTFAFARHIYGGCGGVGDTPYLHSTSPALGMQVRLYGGNVRPTLGFILLGVRANPGLTLGNTCILHVDPASHLLLSTVRADAQGAWSLTFPLPNMQGLVGQSLVVQAVFPGAGAFGLDLTDATVWTFGS